MLMIQMFEINNKWKKEGEKKTHIEIVVSVKYTQCIIYILFNESYLTKRINHVFWIVWFKAIGFNGFSRQFIWALCLLGISHCLSLSFSASVHKFIRICVLASIQFAATVPF